MGPFCLGLSVLWNHAIKNGQYLLGNGRRKLIPKFQYSPNNADLYTDMWLYFDPGMFAKHLKQDVDIYWKLSMVLFTCQVSLLEWGTSTKDQYRDDNIGYIPSSL